MKRFILFLVTASIVFTGCGSLMVRKTTPDKRVTINIFESTMPIAEDSTSVIYPKCITGFKNLPLDPEFDVVLTFGSRTLRETIKGGTEVTKWIDNLPEGLTATIKEARKGTNKITILVVGTPRETSNEPISITIPQDVLTEDVSILRFETEAGYDISEAEPRVQSVLIDGAIGNTITSKDVIIDLPGNQLAGIIAQGSVVSWIRNLPAGLTARIKDAKATKSQVRFILTVEGTPQSESINEHLLISIPAGVLREPLSEPIENPEVKFFITANIRRYSVSENSKVYDFADDDKGVPATTRRIDTRFGPLDHPDLVTPKDYDGVGIVSLSAVQIEKLGADNKYHWTGQTVTYNKLMEEARKLGAHAIINMVIDYVESWEYIEVKQELSPEHKWTDDELAKLVADDVDDKLAKSDTKGTKDTKDKGDESKKILEEIFEGKTRYSVERTRVKTRTYTGTALAIKLR